MGGFARATTMVAALCCPLLASDPADARERLLALGLEPTGGGPRELAERVEHDIRLWTPVIKASGFRAD